MKFNFGKIFLLGFGFFGVSIIWGVYNAFVPIFLSILYITPTDTLLAPVAHFPLAGIHVDRCGRSFDTWRSS